MMGEVISPSRLHDSSMHNISNRTLRSMQGSIGLDQMDDETKAEIKKVLLTQQSELTASLEVIGAQLLSQISDSVFLSKYGLDFSLGNFVQNYMFTQQPRMFTYIFEAFAAVTGLPEDPSQKKKETMVFHSLFEDVIERYTKCRAKPNPVLIETRNSEFCYRLTITVEAVPLNIQANLSSNLSNIRLYREFEILFYVWEKFRDDLRSNTCAADTLIGIPMPFEFVNIQNSDYDFNNLKSIVNYYNIHGNYVPAKGARIPRTGKPLESFLSYMSQEKVGPSLSFLVDLIKSQKRYFSLSSALKILDQLICRLMVLHRYGVILGNLDLKFLNFGVREAVNVLYVNNFDCALVVPTNNKPMSCFNERFASIGIMRNTSHFVNDIESAFYIFLSLLIPRLPWDEKDQDQQQQQHANNHWCLVDRIRNLKMHLDERQKLFDNPALLERLLHNYNINTEAQSSAFEGFAIDVILTVHAKIKDAISACSGIAQQDFMTNVMTATTVPNNAYLSIRRAIVCFFHIEALKSGLRDDACQNKVDRLVEAESTDNRALWDLNNWCWNIFETRGDATSSRNSRVSLKMKI